MKNLIKSILFSGVVIVSQACAPAGGGSSSPGSAGTSNQSNVPPASTIINKWVSADGNTIMDFRTALLSPQMNPNTVNARMENQWPAYTCDSTHAFYFDTLLINGTKLQGTMEEIPSQQSLCNQTQFSYSIDASGTLTFCETSPNSVCVSLVVSN